MPKPGIKRSASLYVSRDCKENDGGGGGKKALASVAENKRVALGLNTSVLNLSINDCTCPICLEILIEPVQMPCHHEVCLPCFKAMTDKTNFLCPMCRMRISTWSRAASNSNTLVNQQRWAQIQRAFPKEIQDRVEGKTAILLAESIKKDKEEPSAAAAAAAAARPVVQHPVAEPGAIRKEYEDYLRREQERLRIEKENEEKLSLDLIQRVLQEEDSVSIDDYMRMVNRNNAPSTSQHNPLVTRANTIESIRPTTTAVLQAPQHPPPPPPPPPAAPVQPAPPVPEEPPAIPRTAQIQRLRCRLERIGNLTDHESTPTTSTDSEVNNIKLRLRPSIKRTRDMVRPIVINPARKALADENKDADSSLDSSTAAGAPADTSTATIDRRLRAGPRTTRGQLNHSNENETEEAAAATTAHDTSAASTPALPKRRMSLRRATRL